MKTKKPNEADTNVGSTATASLRLLEKIDKRLTVYGNDRHGNLRDPLDELIFIILSVQTESYLFRKTFENLKKTFPSWRHVANALEEEIAEAIKQGGLARKKAAQIKKALKKILDERGSLSLQFLRRKGDDEVFRFLTSLPGVGVKTAKCIMMYSLDRPVFPVDTHVWRISRRLGLTPAVPKPSDRQELELERAIPEGLRYRLHVNMVSHGQLTCTTYNPKCNVCVLADICPSRGQADTVWSQWRQPRGVWAKPIVRESGKESTKGGSSIN
jgi:endonuclease III